MNGKSGIRDQDDKNGAEDGAPPIKRRKILAETSNMQTGDNLNDLTNKDDRECKEMQQTKSNVNLRTKIDQLQKQLDKKTQEAGQKEEMLQKLIDEADKSKKFLEDNLRCNVCLELFIKATTLPCSHTFCVHCITEWRKRTNHCPICRKRISITCKSLTLDNLVEKACETLSPDAKNNRSLIVQARNEIPERTTFSVSSSPRYVMRFMLVQGHSVDSVPAASSGEHYGEYRNANIESQESDSDEFYDSDEDELNESDEDEINESGVNDNDESNDSHQ